MLELVSLANDLDARVIFQRGTQQLPAVGRGQPLATLEREIGFGMQVRRINVTRRQLKLEDKRVAQELSSGDAVRFSAAIETLLERGGIRRGGITGAVHGTVTVLGCLYRISRVAASSEPVADQESHGARSRIRKIATVVERIEEALTQAACLAKKLAAAAQRRAERIHELRIKRRRARARSQLREENRGVEIVRV